MTATLKCGVECKSCTKHAPGKTVSKQWGAHKGNDLIAVENMALKLNGVLICCKCGSRIGTDDDEPIPQEAAEVIGSLLTDCFFEVTSVTDQDSGQPFVWLASRLQPNLLCQVRWFRDERWIEGMPERDPKIASAIDYDPSQLKERHPAIVENTIRRLIDRGIALTELPKNGNAYVHMAAIVEHYRTHLATPVVVGPELDPENPPTIEDVRAPLWLQVMLRWN
ncbi:MAG: hypothetical protein KC777_00435 [Cyanobacteria bacterium HKST-UBA02]|nr:hypothetical protein [Cyanobacteria bacterium HKST-UBA02]